MTISIIIVSYNTKDLTLQSIESVMQDTSLRGKEIIVVDNNSTDGSADAIKKLITKNKRINLIENGRNEGFSKANNQGVEISKGAYILLLNSDTKVKKGLLGKLIEFAKMHPDAGVVGAKLLNVDGSVQESCFNFPTIVRAIQQYWLGNGKPLDKYAPIINHQSSITVDALVGAAFLITPQAREKIGGLDERYFFFYEDMAFCREAKRHGLKTYYLPSAEVIHYHGASGAKLEDSDNQWRRLIPSSKTYHGLLKYYIFNFILWSGQKWKKFTTK